MYYKNTSHNVNVKNLYLSEIIPSGKLQHDIFAGTGYIVEKTQDKRSGYRN
jgi:hypothetical protein